MQSEFRSLMVLGCLLDLITAGLEAGARSPSYPSGMMQRKNNIGRKGFSGRGGCIGNARLGVCARIALPSDS
jgi:hypothetical protein